MKKQYITPTAITVKIESQGQLLNFSTTGEKTLNGGGSKGDLGGRSQLSRQSAGWDDED